VQNIGKDTIFRIERSNPDFLKSLQALPKKVREEVKRVEKEELLINPFPRPNDRLIVELRGRYRDIYRIRIAKKYRYVYRVEDTIIYSRYVCRRGNDTYRDIP
jgi:addiction module RelE/StbE family toxin